MRVLSLFSGGGLGDYGLELAGMEIVGQVEIDEYCQKILKLRWPNVPKWRDIKDVTGKEIIERCGQPDIISGGFPCQDISVAGRGVGITGARSGLWKEMLRIICEIRPRFVLVENVTAILSRGMGVVLGDLAASGYDCEWDCIPASAVGAPHRRDRAWILAYSSERKNNGRERGDLDDSEKSREGINPAAIFSGKNVAYSHLKRSIQSRSCPRQNENEFTRMRLFGRCVDSQRSGKHWEVEPNVGRVANGVANRVDRLKLLGNGQVVQVVEWIGKRIREVDDERRNNL